MMKEITVVMPVYKVEKYVSECLDSIINQTFDCFECIIIDDCSPDNSMRLIEEKLAQKNIQRYSREEVMKLWDELFNTLTTARP